MDNKYIDDPIWRHDVCKCIEELNELAAELSKQYNKPHKDYTSKIIEELGDAKYRMDNLIDRYYGTDNIKKRIEFKWGTIDEI